MGEHDKVTPHLARSARHPLPRERAVFSASPSRVCALTGKSACATCATQALVFAFIAQGHADVH